MASSKCFILAFFVVFSILSSINLSLAALPVVPTLPKPTLLPPLPTLPLPTTQPSVPNSTQLPPLPNLPTKPSIPQVTLPPTPNIPLLPTFPTTIPSIPFFSPPPSATITSP
ncbi:hypothetical protein RGQ29_018284 [Quercus rubra]|uniref:Uncharacterized protein n=1 Tax=Quercus rubra TaxID=3512 RepID=A0AAN7FIX0_QUERU|nr:hypothetical protein RGQ29_018284 [Quercus rubra]